MPSTVSRPADGALMAPRIPSSVDLPAPDSPMIDTNSPGAIRKLTPETASTAESPVPYRLVNSSARM